MVAKDGSHEAIVFNLVPTAGIPQAELMKVKTDILNIIILVLIKVVIKRKLNFVLMFCNWLNQSLLGALNHEEL